MFITNYKKLFCIVLMFTVTILMAPAIVSPSPVLAAQPAQITPISINNNTTNNAENPDTLATDANKVALSRYHNHHHNHHHHYQNHHRYRCERVRRQCHHHCRHHHNPHLCYRRCVRQHNCHY